MWITNQTIGFRIISNAFCALGNSASFAFFTIFFNCLDTICKFKLNAGPLVVAAFQDACIF
jgi:hypothetical protein